MSIEHLPAMVGCPECGSFRIAKFRYDSDWGYAGDFTAANTDDTFQPLPGAQYTPGDLRKFDQNERVDISCHVCIECETCFE